MDNKDLDLSAQFVRLEWLLHRHHLRNYLHHGPMGDPHRGQGRVLALLRLSPEISQKELSNILDMRSQSLGELLAKLERGGYITRTPSETDRRVMDIRLTEAGREASGKNEQQLDPEALFGCLNEEEQAALSDYLGRIISTLEEKFGGSESDPDFRGRPSFGGRGFGRHFDMEGGRPHFNGRDFSRCPDMRDGRPPFDGRSYGRCSNDGNKPDDSSENK
ncbi:MAG TPA: MarR family transcriptional regulator [Syntrophomonadaceae bacterium]|nr:MarR family transcriptional regulator [Syntrophomonadaceae bacterium]